MSVTLGVDSGTPVCDSQRRESQRGLCVDIGRKNVRGREMEVVESMCKVGSGDPEVVLPVEPALGLTRNPSVKHDHVVLAEQARVLDLRLHPRGVQAGGMEEDEGGLVGVEGADGVAGRVRPVP